MRHRTHYFQFQPGVELGVLWQSILRRCRPPRWNPAILPPRKKFWTLWKKRPSSLSPRATLPPGLPAEKSWNC
jgi:hypothetical protein